MDQAYLRYRLEGAALSPHVVLIGYSPDNINRVVNVFCRFRNDKETVLAKPRYALAANGALSLIETPLRDRAGYEALLRDPRTIRRFGKYDHWYEPCQYDNPLYDYSLTVRLGCAVASRAYRKYVDPDHPIAGQLYNADSTAFKIQESWRRPNSRPTRARRGARARAGGAGASRGPKVVSRPRPARDGAVSDRDAGG